MESDSKTINLKSSSPKSVIYSEEFLLSSKCVDTSPRKIKSSEMVEFNCRCGCQGSRKWVDAQKTNKLYGFFYQCSDCRVKNIQKRSQNEKWLAGVRKAAQSDAHKERARQNGKRRLSTKQLQGVVGFWYFGDVDLQNTSGTDIVSAVCKTCDNTSKKPLKKYIESVGHQTHGCSWCWDKLTQTDEYSKVMGERSQPARSKARVQQGETLRKFWDGQTDEKKKAVGLKLRVDLDSWLEKNPDKAFSSKAELEILSWVTQDLSLPAHKLRMGGKELDIYIPSLNIGIEYNGLYWHSEAQKDKNYHFDKTEFFESHGIRVIHVFENEWRDRKDQIKSYLRSALNQNKFKVGARRCSLVDLSPREAISMLDEFHIQGGCRFKEAIGLVYSGQLISLATFGHHHRKSGVWVLSRFVTRDDWTVQGGLSRLSTVGYKRFGDLVSWADLRWSQGSGYIGAGWEVDETLRPDYFYTDTINTYSKQSRMRSVAKTPEGVTEREHALSDRLLRVYDCGKVRLRFKR